MDPEMMMQLAGMSGDGGDNMYGQGPSMSGFGAPNDDYIKRLEVLAEMSRAGVSDKYIMPMYQESMSQSLFPKNTQKKVGLEDYMKAGQLYSAALQSNDPTLMKLAQYAMKETGFNPEEASPDARPPGSAPSSFSDPKIGMAVNNSNRALVQGIAGRIGSATGEDRGRLENAYQFLDDQYRENPEADLQKAYKNRYYEEFANARPEGLMGLATSAEDLVNKIPLVSYLPQSRVTRNFVRNKEAQKRFLSPDDLQGYMSGL
jgi:hypothetical protein